MKRHTGFVRKVAPTRCMWFLNCKHPATGFTHHPTLGNVPTCDRCHKFASGSPRTPAGGRSSRRKRNPLQAGATRYVVVARERKKKGAVELVYDGRKFTRRGRPVTYATKTQASVIARQLTARYAVLGDWDVSVSS